MCLHCIYFVLIQKISKMRQILIIFLIFKAFFVFVIHIEAITINRELSKHTCVLEQMCTKFCCYRTHLIDSPVEYQHLNKNYLEYFLLFFRIFNELFKEYFWCFLP